MQRGEPGHRRAGVEVSGGGRSAMQRMRARRAAQCKARSNATPIAGEGTAANAPPWWRGVAQHHKARAGHRVGRAPGQQRGGTRRGVGGRANQSRALARPCKRRLTHTATGGAAVLESASAILPSISKPDAGPAGSPMPWGKPAIASTMGSSSLSSSSESVDAASPPEPASLRPPSSCEARTSAPMSTLSYDPSEPSPAPVAGAASSALVAVDAAGADPERSPRPRSASVMLSAARLSVKAASMSYPSARPGCGASAAAFASALGSAMLRAKVTEGVAGCRSCRAFLRGLKGRGSDPHTRVHGRQGAAASLDADLHDGLRFAVTTSRLCTAIIRRASQRKSAHGRSATGRHLPPRPCILRVGLVLACSSHSWACLPLQGRIAEPRKSAWLGNLALASCAEPACTACQHASAQARHR